MLRNIRINAEKVKRRAAARLWRNVDRAERKGHTQQAEVFQDGAEFLLEEIHRDEARRAFTPPI